jgi:hypothetical protein
MYKRYLIIDDEDDVIGATDSLDNVQEEVDAMTWTRVTSGSVYVCERILKVHTTFSLEEITYVE